MEKKEKWYLGILLLLFMTGFIFLLTNNLTVGFIIWMIVLLAVLFKKEMID